MDFDAGRRGHVPTAVEPEAVGPLVQILELLQGEGTGRTDAAVARLPPHAMDQIALAAQNKGQHCVDLVRCLLECSNEALMTSDEQSARRRALQINAHIGQLLDECVRWCELQDNATYYRWHPELTARVAEYLSRSGR